MKKLLLVLSVLLISCATPPPEFTGPKTIRYSFAKNFGSQLVGIDPDSAKQQFRKAANKWGSVCGVNLVERNFGGVIIIIEKPLSNKTLGSYGKSGIILIDISKRKWNDLLFYKVSLHEIGHAIGLPHIMHSGSIMHKAITNKYKLSVFDIEAARAIYGP